MFALIVSKVATAVGVATLALTSQAVTDNAQSMFEQGEVEIDVLEQAPMIQQTDWGAEHAFDLRLVSDTQWRTSVGSEPSRLNNAGWPAVVKGQVNYGAFRGALVLNHGLAWRPSWDAANHKLVATRDDAWRFERYFVQMSGDAWEVVAGHYAVSFGERLTLSTHAGGLADGMAANAATWSRPGFERIYLQKGFRGVAAAMDANSRVGLWLLRAFVAQTERDLNQNDLLYLTPWVKDCTWPARCDSRSIVDPNGQSMHNLALSHAFVERLLGADVEWVASERWRLGALGYIASTRFTAPRAAAMRFANASSYPERSRFGAAGVFGEATFRAAKCAMEISLTDRRSGAAVGRLELKLHARSHLRVKMRWYGVDYDNPFSQAGSAADEYLGNRARNERGVVVGHTLRFTSWLQWQASVDVWQPQRRVQLHDGELRSKLLQRLNIDLTRREKLTIHYQAAVETLGLFRLHARLHTGRVARTKIEVGGTWIQQANSRAWNCFGRLGVTMGAASAWSLFMRAFVEGRTARSGTTRQMAAIELNRHLFATVRATVEYSVWHEVKARMDAQAKNELSHLARLTIDTYF